MTLVVHYSCESFYDRPDGSSPRITSIAVRNLESGQTESFSIHQIAEIKRIPLDKIESSYHDLERDMLKRYFGFVKRNENCHWIHWNMRDQNFGFAALEHRYRVHGRTPTQIHESRKIDLARLMVDLYGRKYIGDPKMLNLVEKNKLNNVGFLNGQQEADAFVAKDFVKLHQSTLRKVDVISNIFYRSHNKTLKTDAGWWELHGGSVKGITDWLVNHPLYALAGGAVGVAAWLWPL